MLDTILIIVLFVMMIAGVVVRKTYYYVPAFELQRRASKRDHLATKLYPAVVYGGSLRSLLWLYIALTTALAFILLARRLPIIVSLIIIAAVLWVAFSWLPNSRQTKIGIRLTAAITPAVIWVLSHLQPILEKPANVIQKRTSVVEHTGVFEREDLLGLIAVQRQQHDNRLDEADLAVVERALQFNDARLSDVMTPANEVKTILASDTFGPILFDELHKSGQQTVIVKDKTGGKIVGTLNVSQLALKTTGHVRSVMNDTVCYVNQKDSFGEALQAFFATNQTVFVVIDDHEEFTGIISIEQIVRQLVGDVAYDDFDRYADSHTVAARHSGPADMSLYEDVMTDDDNATSDEADLDAEPINEPETIETIDDTEIPETTSSDEPPAEETQPDNNDDDDQPEPKAKPTKSAPHPQITHDDDIETIEFDNTTNK